MAMRGNLLHIASAKAVSFHTANNFSEMAFLFHVTA